MLTNLLRNSLGYIRKVLSLKIPEFWSPSPPLLEFCTPPPKKRSFWVELIPTPRQFLYLWNLEKKN